MALCCCSALQNYRQVHPALLGLSAVGFCTLFFNVYLFQGDSPHSSAASRRCLPNSSLPTLPHSHPFPVLAARAGRQCEGDHQAAVCGPHSQGEMRIACIASDHIPKVGDV